MKKNIPEIQLKLRQRIIKVPDVIYEASGIKIMETRIKSLLFSTDVSIIENTNADAIIAVYPFTPQLSITQAVLDVARVPVLCGVGGGVTTGKRSISIALQAELLGAYGVVVNAPMTNDVIAEMVEEIDVPIVATVVSEHDDVKGKIESGARILNISGGADTEEIVKKIRDKYPNIPIIATGGPTEKSIYKTIQAGANAITYTPPCMGDIFSEVMIKYRQRLKAT